jgi:hypothetical protein
MNTFDISHQALKILVEQEPHLLYDETGTLKIKPITEQLELELKNRLKGLRVSISDIKGVKSRFILLIGNNDEDLLDAIGAYIYCLNCIEGGTSLFYHSFRGKPDVYLEGVLTAKCIFKNQVYFRNDPTKELPDGRFVLISDPTKQLDASRCTGYPSKMDGDLLDHIAQGRSVFLSDLKYPSSLLLEGIGKRIKGIKTVCLCT